MLVNGATCGIMSAIGALTSRGDRVLIARNCHISVYRAVKLFGLKPEYILPEYAEENGVKLPVFGSIFPESIEDKLTQNPDISLVVLTSPTYEGVVSDIKSISEICKKHGARLFVDEAHGAHFPFNRAFPESSVDCGADISVVSLHKTLPSLTQTALLLTNNTDYDSALREQLAIFQTSSPSYVLMSSVESCLDYISENSSEFESYIKRLSEFEKSAKALNNLKVLFREDNNVYAYDRGKLVISTIGTSISGTQLAEMLRNDYKIETEMSAEDYIIAMTSVCDTDEGFERLINALKAIDKRIEKAENSKNLNILSLPQKACEPFECSDKIGKVLDITDCNGKISLEDVFAYPPGIPLIVSGEIVTDDIINQVKTLADNNISVQSTLGNAPHKLKVDVT
jgi:arginine/lysine/ornithine decarboxylase